MKLSIRILLSTCASVAVFLAGIGIALADDGSPTRACTSPDRGPSCTILRPLPLPKREPPVGAPECIVAVGGLGSSNDDGTFDDLLGSFRDDPRYVIHRFGSTAEHPELYGYDTYGSIDASARALVAFVRSLSPACHAIHIVAHSMGGDVADRAFSLGLSAADGVATYAPISTPHNGAMVARFIAKYRDRDADFAEAEHELAQELHVHDPTTAAVRDLANIRPPRPPRGVVEVRQRLASDEFVFLPDNWDYRYEMRDRIPDAELLQLEGHGGSLKNAGIRRTTERLIRSDAMPPDDRDDAFDKKLGLILSIALMTVALIIGKFLDKALYLGIMAGKGLKLQIAAALGVIVGPLVGFLKWTLSARSIAKGVIDLLKTALPNGGETDDSSNDLVTRRVVDPRVAMVRGVLDRASLLLGGR